MKFALRPKLWCNRSGKLFLPAVRYKWLKYNTTRQIKVGNTWLHILCCAVFMSMAVFSTPHRAGLLGSLHNPFYRSELLEYAFTTVFFYLNYFVLIPRFYFRRRYVLFALLALLGFAVVSILPELLFHIGHGSGHGPDAMGGAPPAFGPPPGPLPGSDGLIPFTALRWYELGPLDQNFLKYSAVFILAITIRVSSQLRRIQKEKADTEIMFLKAQINPHFLFNTLNSIYTLAIEAEADDTAKAIVQLSAMMRYATTEASAHAVDLSKELAYIDSYLTLQRLRLNDRVRLTYSLEGRPAGEKVAPFLLIPFIENAFKYGVSTDQDSDIQIHIGIDDGRLSLKVANNKVYVAPGRDFGTSIGIHNTRQRLELLYPGRHELVVSDLPRTFEVLMRVTL